MLKAAIKLRTSLMSHLKTAESKCDGYADNDVENLRYALDKLADVIEALELVDSQQAKELEEAERDTANAEYEVTSGPWGYPSSADEL